MRNRRTIFAALIVLAGMLLQTGSALQPANVTFQWDYNLSVNQGVTGFEIWRTSGGRIKVANVPLPSPLPVPDATGFAVFSADVAMDKVGNNSFVAIAITADSLVFSDDSNSVVVLVKPDSPRNMR